jgi:hypothetical protein
LKELRQIILKATIWVNLRRSTTAVAATGAWLTLTNVRFTPNVPARAADSPCKRMDGLPAAPSFNISICSQSIGLCDHPDIVFERENRLDGYAV